MSTIDVERALTPVEGEDPCGPRLTDEIPIMMLLEKAKGTPETVMGDSVRPAEEPNWSDIRSEAMDLLGQTKDLWLGMLLTLAGLKIGGVPGLSEGLAVVDSLLERHWEGMHPRPDEDGDHYERMSALSALSAPASSFGDDWRFVERLREAPLSDSRQLGRFSLRHIEVSTGELSPREDEEPPSPELIEASFEDTEVEPLQALLESTGKAIESLQSIRERIDGHLGPGSSPEFAPLHSSLGEIRTLLAQHLERRGYAAEGAEGEGESGEAVGVDQPSSPGVIRTAADVTRQLDRIIEYYVKQEPSSPVPLLLKRAQRLVSRSFMDIVKDLSPEALDQIRLVSGEREEED